MASSNLNAILSDIYERFVQIKDSDFRLHYRVIDSVFHRLHQKMKEVDPYYRRYSSTVQFGGSHYDNVRIVKPDEFDMTIVINLPVDIRSTEFNEIYNITIEPKSAGFVQLRMGPKFQNLPENGREWPNNRAAYEWMDNANYLQSSKFMNWFKSVVSQALNKFDQGTYYPQHYVDGVVYNIRKSESGPAMTLIIENNRGFKLDVDLVPALKFPEWRWTTGSTYRRIPAKCARGDWMVVAKSIKNGNPHDESRSWRIARPEQERELIHDSGNLRQAWRLVKKLRDTLEMNKIASYFIKNLFFWAIVERQWKNKNFWHNNNPADLFKFMVGRLHQALKAKRIPYFWNENENLLGRVPDSVLVEYAAALAPLVRLLEVSQDYKKVAIYLLTPDEFRKYNM